MIFKVFVLTVLSVFAWMVRSILLQEQPVKVVKVEKTKNQTVVDTAADTAHPSAQIPAQRLPIRIGWNNNPPRKYWNDQKPEGLAMPFLESVLNKASLQPEFIPCDLQTCLQWIREDKIDAVVETMKNAEREQFLDYVDPQLPVKIDMVFYSLSRQPVTHVADLDRLRLAHVGQNWPFATLRSKSVASPQQGLLALGKGEIDALFSPEDITDYLISRKNLVVTKSQLRQSESMLVHLIAIGKNSPRQEQKELLRQTIESFVLHQQPTMTTRESKPDRL